MTRLTCWVFISILSLGALACGGSETDVPDEDTSVNETAGTTGAAGELPQPPSPIGDAAQRTEEAERAAEELPSTASPLPLAGLVGLLSLGTAMGVRFIRRR